MLQYLQGPKRNFEIGGGAQSVTQYWGGTKHFFLLILYNYKNIGEVCAPPPPPTLRSLTCNPKLLEILHGNVAFENNVSVGAHFVSCFALHGGFLALVDFPQEFPE